MLQCKKKLKFWNVLENIFLLQETRKQNQTVTFIKYLIENYILYHGFSFDPWHTRHPLDVGAILIHSWLIWNIRNVAKYFNTASVVDRYLNNSELMKKSSFQVVKSQILSSAYPTFNILRNYGIDSKHRNLLFKPYLPFAQNLS